ncbi:MAG TPA: phospholipid carrier-dependent glycosyltransferase [Aeromicrobium sp.]|nr:phospholipid carrier-dependent glycosyltransferase [Aeromicrobium sp.]HKY58732.1 phospholipid carrier-dependent glycosyltransferase [Aeromicrobium sp.]
MSERAKGWFWPAAVSLLALGLRLWQLDRPRGLSFDERYYAENAWSMLKVGYAQDFVEGAEERIARGDLHDLFVVGQPNQVVHPDAAKWLIAAGEAAFGFNSFGWRIASAIVGTLTVFVLCRLVLRLTGSLPFACLAGFLIALDGVHLTMSRLALLDIFVTFWIVCAVACLAADRDWIAARLTDANERFRIWRPWQLAAGVCFGLACGSKWNGIYALAAFGLAVVVWELFVRMSLGPIRPVRATLGIGVPAFGWLVVVGAAVYVVTYLGWLVNHDVYEERFGHGYGDEPAWGAYVDDPSSGPIEETTDALRSLWHYQAMSYRFHTGEYLAKQDHPYQSDAIGWLIQWRPVSAAADLNLPAKQCGAPAGSYCMRETLILGNPAVWWSGVLAMVACAVLWLRKRRWQYSVPVVGLLGTWVPWLPILDRPIFSFYAVATLPFLVVALTLALHAAWTGSSTPRQRYASALAIGLVVLLTVVAAAYFWPIWTHGLTTWDAWHQRMWLPSWI